MATENADTNHDTDQALDQRQHSTTPTPAGIAATAPPGWYDVDQKQRYWNGNKWTHEVRDRP